MTKDQASDIQLCADELKESALILRDAEVRHQRAKQALEYHLREAQMNPNKIPTTEKKA